MRGISSEIPHCTHPLFLVTVNMLLFLSLWVVWLHYFYVHQIRSEAMLLCIAVSPYCMGTVRFPVGQRRLMCRSKALLFWYVMLARGNYIKFENFGSSLQHKNMDVFVIRVTVLSVKPSLGLSILWIDIKFYHNIEFLCAVLQIRRSLVQYQMVSLEFFIEIILPIALWPWVRLSL